MPVVTLNERMKFWKSRCACGGVRRFRRSPVPSAGQCPSAVKIGAGGANDLQGTCNGGGARPLLVLQASPSVPRDTIGAVSACLFLVAFFPVLLFFLGCPPGHKRERLRSPPSWGAWFCPSGGAPSFVVSLHYATFHVHVMFRKTSTSCAFVFCSSPCL